MELRPLVGAKGGRKEVETGPIAVAVWGEMWGESPSVWKNLKGYSVLQIGMAERVGFEPTEGLRLLLISSQARSATPAPLQDCRSCEFLAFDKLLSVSR